LQEQFDGAEAAQTAFLRLRLACQLFGEGKAKAVPTDVLIDLVLAAGQLGPSTGEPRKLIAATAPEIFKRAPFQSKQEREAIYPLRLAYAEALGPSVQKLKVYRDLLRDLRSEELHAIPPLELTRDVLQK